MSGETKCARLGRDKVCMTMCAFEGEEKECYRFEPTGRLRVIYVTPEHLRHHPDNPRKDVGDVSELAASIGQEGIRQPLTVIPYVDDDGNEVMGQYTVVIGHRRLEAARAAGLEEVPCIETNMDRAEQLATMLTENMQRVDLTPVEQADGFQMMLELPGATVASVAERTGFSETTVRRRLKLRELDREALRAADGRGVTLAEYEKLNQLKDPERRNRALKVIGTAEFNRTLQLEKDSEEMQRHRDRLVKSLERKGAKRIARAERTSRKDLEAAQNLYRWSWKNAVVEPLKMDSEYVFTVDDQEIRVFRVKSEQEKAQQTAAEELERKRLRSCEELDALREEMMRQDRDFQALREEFVAGFSTWERNREEIMEFAIRAMLYSGFYQNERLAQWLGIEYREGRFDDAGLSRCIRTSPEKVLLYAAYLKLDDGRRTCTEYYGRDNAMNTLVIRAKEDPQGALLYRCLNLLGYGMSQEERAVQTGKCPQYDRAAFIVREWKAAKKETEK